MSKEIHVCIGCGKDTTALGAICEECYEYSYDSVVGDYDDRSDYDKEIDDMMSFGRDDERE